MKYVSFHLPKGPKQKAPDQWTAHFPSPPDNTFNYYNLMQKCLDGKQGIGEAPAEAADNPVCIVGAGIAGITAARELVRCGYTVKLFEASSRIGGRHDTRSVEGQVTAMEMGAMRFPFFNSLDPNEAPGQGSKNCLLDYYFTTEAKGRTTPFTNPGQTDGGTGIWINNGLGPNGTFVKPNLISWDNGGEPDNIDLKFIHDRVSKFVGNVQVWANKYYGQAEWTDIWDAIVGYYSRMSVEDLVFTDYIDQPDPASPVYPENWLGGLGFNQKQSELFYTIGSGDGSWGAFYQVGSLWFLRCVMFGFQNNLQALIDIPSSSGTPHKGETLKDSSGTSYPGPTYKGIQSLDEWLFYSPIPGTGKSLYDLAHAGEGSNQFRFYIKSPITGLEFSSTGIVVDGDSDIFAKYIVLTPTLSSVERHIDIRETGSIEDATTRITRERAIKTQHNINSCKVFYPLKETYWENSKSNIPQNIVTDTVIQDAYGVKWTTDPEDKGVLLVSYTWEDEAAKLIADMDSPIVLAKFLLNKLDEITVLALGEKISDYVSDINEPTVIHWGGEDYFRACAKLYRSRNESYNKVLLAYNNLDRLGTGSKPISRLFLAGENYSTEGGWTEPALRGAIDAVINVIRRTGGTFINGFDYDQNYLPKIRIPDVSDEQTRYPYPPLKIVA